MKISELRRLVSHHDGIWYVGKMVFGEYKEVADIKSFLQQHANKFQDYELQPQDLLALARLLPADSNLMITNEIRAHFSDNPLFLSVFAILDAAKLIDEKNFPQIYGLSFKGLSLFYELFVEQKIPLKPEVLDLVLMLNKQYLSNEIIPQFLMFLDEKNLLADARVVKLLADKKEALDEFFKISRCLAKQQMLDYKGLSFAAEAKFSHLLAKCLKLLEVAAIRIDYKLLKNLAAHQNLSSVLEMLEVFIPKNIKLINKGMIEKILLQDFQFLFVRTPVLKTLFENKLADEKLVAKILDVRNVFVVSSLLRMLGAKNLLEENKKIIVGLFSGEIDDWQFYKIINYINKLTFLESERLNSIFQLTKTNPKHPIFELFENFDQVNFKLSQPNFEKMFTLSETNVSRLCNIVRGLIDTKQLNQTTLQAAVDRVTLKLPSVAKSSVEKESKKETGKQRSQIKIDSQMKFFMEHKRSHLYARGNYGKVKKGFAGPCEKATTAPIVALKKFYEKDLTKSEKEAEREAKYHRLLGRQSHYFARNGFSSLVSTWLTDKAMHRFKPKEMMKAPLAKRFDCLISAFNELDILHSKFRIHGDVKSENFILDLQKATLKLIDLGSAHKSNAHKIFPYTAEYCDGTIQSITGKTFCDDMYAMGIVTAQLFPELYDVTFSGSEYVRKYKNSNPTPVEKSIYTLVDAMMHHERTNRCTSQDALHFAQQIKNNFYKLDEMMLQKITAETLHHANPSVEDVFRGKRPALR